MDQTTLNTSYEMNNPIEYRAQILELRKNSGPMYGDNVIPAIKLFTSLSDTRARLNFQKAIESLLSDNDKNIREYGVTLCMGFITFRDTI